MHASMEQIIYSGEEDTVNRPTNKMEKKIEVIQLTLHLTRWLDEDRSKLPFLSKRFSPLQHLMRSEIVPQLLGWSFQKGQTCLEAL